MKIGAHESIKLGLDKSIDLAVADGCEAMQIFVKNSSRWTAKPLEKNSIDAFLQKSKTFGSGNICAHATYLINLASANEVNIPKSISAIRDELLRCDSLDIPYYVLHPGAHGGLGVDVGIEKIVNGLNNVYEEDFKCVTLLETTAGQGTSIGHKIEHIAKIMDEVKFKDKIGVCLDTCHLYAAGYDLVLEYESVISDIFSLYGDKVKVCHINDSKKDLNTRVDRHELISKGFIGEGMFRKLVNDSRFRDVLGILETPVEDNFSKEIELLKSFREHRP